MKSTVEKCEGEAENDTWVNISQVSSQHPQIGNMKSVDFVCVYKIVLPSWKIGIKNMLVPLMAHAYTNLFWYAGQQFVKI